MSSLAFGPFASYRQRAERVNDVIPSLVSVHQPAMRSHLSAELHRVPMPAVPVAARSAARSQSAFPTRRQILDQALRGALQEQPVALWLRRLGQERMDSARDQEREHRVAI